ncbi:bleomycin resistance protein [Burkholderia stagnalis]|uniref:VOC family protein n=1 Tax=Burkholderia stagnalis TaxID=1503054 RepID=UPI00075F301D|nr:VOC family protein [Burkholderia stagnalis]KVD87783.1 bleomycin resistance protein [Burkholderia stagnalis]KWK26932.1 bleomycin resistance protein [Burkholderia stagnalis]
MNVQLNHTIVWCRDKLASTRFLTDLLELPPPVPFGPMLVVQLENGVSLDFYERSGAIAAQHYAFLIDEAAFDRAFARIQARGLTYWADPSKQRAGEIYRHNGGRGLYFDDPDGHFLEVMTRPYVLDGQA